MVLRPPIQVQNEVEGPVWSVPSRRSRRAMGLLFCSLLTLAVSLTVSLVGCQPKARQGAVWPKALSTPPPLPEVSLRAEPTVRVRIVRRALTVTLGSGSDLMIGPTASQQDRATARAFTSPVVISHDANGFVIRGSQGVRWALDALEVTASLPITVGSVTYPQSLVIYPSSEVGKIDVVNHVSLEAYLPGVLQKELYSYWEPGVFAAQAVAARSYAITEHFKYTKRFYDLESTTASQAYAGLNASSRAREAVARTRGLVLAYQGRIVPGYYSSCCGGSSQDAALAFRHGQDIAPLQGLRRAGWCYQSKRYRWGPITRETDALGRRMIAWAVKAKHPLARLTRIARIQISQYNRAGRPAQFTITDTTGKRYVLMAESFRFACNADAPGLGKLKSHAKLYSSHVQVRVAGDKVLFTDGRGFGHGVGLCQFGAQAMAQNGIGPARILSYYYPRSTLRRAY